MIAKQTNQMLLIISSSFLAAKVDLTIVNIEAPELIMKKALKERKVVCFFDDYDGNDDDNDDNDDDENENENNLRHY